MKLKVTENTENRIRFTVSGIDVSLANALRRIVISEVPSMAIESVTYYENSSILNDEVLALRLGLMPLTTDLKTYNTVEECTCKGKGCAKCTVTLTLEAKGPCVVHSGQIKSTDEEVRPVYDTIPLVKLAEGQEIKLEAKAEIGTGKRHMKWQAGLASYEIKEDGSFDFFIETFHQHSLSDLIDISFKTFNKKIEDLKEALK